VVVQQNRQFDEVANRPLTLEKLTLVEYFSQLGKVHVHQFR